MTEPRWRVTRRRFLEVAGLATVVTRLPLAGCGSDGSSDPIARRSFFTAAERDALESAAEVILPSGGGLGARENDAIGYLENLLTAFDVDPPAIFAGGPFSGRFPFADPQTGAPSSRYPEPSFRFFLPLTRVQELSFRAQIFGSATVPEIARNDAVAGVHLGWRTIYREGAAALDAAARALGAERISALSPADQERVLDSLDTEATINPRTGSSFVSQLTEHVIEGVFGDPVYGGNRDRRAWAAIRFEGDSQPLGYTQYAAGDATFRERGDSPMSRPDPDEIASDGSLLPRSLPDDIQEFVKSLILPRKLF